MNTKIHYWTYDVDKVLSYYVEKLGFSFIYKQPPEEPSNFCILQISDTQIMFAGPPIFDLTSRNDQSLLEIVSKRIGKSGPISVYIGINDIDAYFNSIVDREANVVEPIWNTPWGLRQFSVLDPDGNITTFFSDKE